MGVGETIIVGIIMNDSVVTTGRSEMGMRLIGSSQIVPQPSGHPPELPQTMCSALAQEGGVQEMVGRSGLSTFLQPKNDKGISKSKSNSLTKSFIVSLLHRSSNEAFIYYSLDTIALLQPPTMLLLFYCESRLQFFF